MPNISLSPHQPAWPRDLDDLRCCPGRIVTLSDLARIGVVRSYDGARHLPSPLRMPGRQKCWEARTILLWMGATLETSSAQQSASSNPALTLS